MRLRTLYILSFIIAGLASSLLLLFPFISVQFNLNLTEVSLLKSVFNVTSILFTVPSLYIINRFNNKKLLFLVDTLLALSFAALGIAPSFFVIMLFRVFYSVNMSIRNPLHKSEITRQAKPGQQGKAIGASGSISEIGKTLIATLCGYIIIWWGWQTASIILGLAGAAVIIITAALSWKHPYQDQLIKSGRIDLKETLKNKKLLISYTCSFLDTFASNSIPLFMPFLILYYKYDVSYLPLVNAVMLVGAIAGRGILGGVADKYRPGIIFAICELIMGTMALILGLSGNIVTIFIAAFGIGIVTRGTLPVTAVMLVRSVGQEKNPKSAFALEMLLANVSGMVSSTLFGWIGDMSSLPVMFFCFFIAALFPAAAGLFYDRITRSKTDSLTEVELQPAVN